MVSYVAVVGAADGVGRAAAPGAHADDGDRGAGHADKDVDVLDDDAEQAQQGGARGRPSLSITNVSERFEQGTGKAYGLGGVAALQVPGGAIGGSAERDGVGGRKERESGESESEDAGEHHIAGECGSW